MAKSNDNHHPDVVTYQILCMMSKESQGKRKEN